MDTLKLTQEISTWEYLAGTLTQDHQQSVRCDIMNKVNAMKAILKEREQSANTEPEELRLAVVMPALPFYCVTCGSKFSQKPETEYCPICKYYSIKGNAV